MIRTRNLARVGATALLAAGALTAFGTPASAAPTDADLAVNLTGTTLAATATGKDAELTVTNKSKAGVASGVVVLFDLSDLDMDKVEFPLPDEEACEVDGDQVACAVEDLKAGVNADLTFRIIRQDDATGDAGSITIAVAHEGTDPDEKNNVVKRKVTIGDSGPDLYAWAWDVPLNEDDTYGTVKPGETAPLYFIVGNQGDEATAGFSVTAKLPKGATFAAPFEGCAFSGDKRTATCTYANLPIIPEDEDTDTEEGPWSWYGFDLTVKVDADAKSGVNLTDGVVTAAGTKAVDAARIAQKAVKLPAGVRGLSAKDIDVDPTDNSDEFTIFVGKADADGGSGGGDGGGLPVTGAQAGLIGGVGGGAVLVGAALFLMTRRRKVVLVAPGDEKTPTA